MRKQRSGMSVDGEEQQRRPPSPTDTTNTRCPSCRQLLLTTVDVDGEFIVSICGGCNCAFGFDDSMDTSILAILLADKELCSDVRMSVASCDRCRNDDVNRFVVVDHDPSSMILRVKCMDCDNVSDIPLQVWNNEEQHRVVSDDDYLAYCKDGSPDILPFICSCGNSEVNCFEQHIDPVSGNLLSVSCLICDHEQEVELPFCIECWHCQNDNKELFARQFDECGRMTQLQCLVCEKQLEIPAVVKEPTVTRSIDDECLRYDEDDSLETVPFTCFCGNSEVNCFEQHIDPISGDLLRVTCLVCDHDEIVDAPFCVECWDCKNDKKELFERRFDDCGRMTLLRCLVCWKQLEIPGQPIVRRQRAINDVYLTYYGDDSLGSMPFNCVFSNDEVGREDRTDTRWNNGGSAGARGVGLGRTKITDLREVRRGDHIAWHKWYAIWHHAIVVDVPDDGLTLTVIHYSGDTVKLDEHLVSVRLETINVNPWKEDFYRIDYSGETYSVSEVVDRASSRISEAKYNPITNNCEHFARWCKTGDAESSQVRTFKDRLKFTPTSGAVKAAQEAVADSLESLFTGRLVKVGLKGIGGRARQVFGATSGVARNVKCGMMAFGVAVNLAFETAVFVKNAIAAYRKYRSGAISGDEFKRQLCKDACECTGGFIGASALGILGEVLIPLPFVGGVVGSILGNLIGRYAGAVVGKQLQGSIKH